ncbi:MAG: hypothetical protein ROO73_06245 [Roseivirga sp.]
MKKPFYCSYPLIKLLLVFSTSSCSGPEVRVPDQTIAENATEHLDESGRYKKLDEKWETQIGLLGSKRQRCKLRGSLWGLDEEARAKLRLMIEAMPRATERAGFLEELAFLDREERKRLLNILVYLYDKDTKLILEIFRKSGQVSIVKKIRFNKMEKRLPPADRSLLNTLIKELEKYEED